MSPTEAAGAFSRLREKAGDEGGRARPDDPHPHPLPQAGEGEGAPGSLARAEGGKGAPKPVPLAEDTEAALQDLYDAVEAEPWAYDFFALLRRVEQLSLGLPRIATAARPQGDALRLGQEPEMDFAPASLARFDRRGEVPRLGVRLFGLLGPQGPMPLHFTEYVRERSRQRGDATLARFLDVFHHRLLSLFYRAWAQAQPVVQHDRPADDRFAAWLGASFGLGDATRQGDSIPDAAKLHQAGLLGSRSRHAEGLEKLLRQYFGVPVRVQQRVAHWLPLEREDRSRLGFARARGATHPGAGLGVDAAIGSKVRDRQFKFRIVLGPLSMAQYLAFVPGGSAWRPLRDWVRLYAGRDLLWDVELCLERAPAGAPPPGLASRPRLGLTAWAGRAARTRERCDLRLRPDTSYVARLDKRRAADAEVPGSQRGANDRPAARAAEHPTGASPSAASSGRAM